MAGHTCYHCKQWVEKGEPHDCWTTTEAALTRDLSEDLQEAYERIRETAVEFGEQRIYASHSSIMFSRKACHFFVRPKKSCLELCIFLPRALRHPLVRKADASSKTKFYNMVRITHRDQVEPPITEWMSEAFQLEDTLAATPRSKRTSKRSVKSRGAKRKATVRPQRAKKR